MNYINKLGLTLAITLCLGVSAWAQQSAEMGDAVDQKNVRPLPNQTQPNAATNSNAAKDILAFKMSMNQKLNALNMKIARLESNPKAKDTTQVKRIKDMRENLEDNLEEIDTTETEGYSATKRNIEQQYVRLEKAVEQVENNRK